MTPLNPVPAAVYVAGLYRFASYDIRYSGGVNPLFRLNCYSSSETGGVSVGSFECGAEYRALMFGLHGSRAYAVTGFLEYATFAMAGRRVEGFVCLAFPDRPDPWEPLDLGGE